MDKIELNIGDTIEIVNYGHPMWVTKGGHEYEIFKDHPRLSESEKTIIIDMHPEYIGQKGIIKEKSKNQNGGYEYSINGTSKSAWWNEDQLKLVTQELV